MAGDVRFSRIIVCPCQVFFTLLKRCYCLSKCSRKSLRKKTRKKKQISPKVVVLAEFFTFVSSSETEKTDGIWIWAPSSFWIRFRFRKRFSRFHCLNLVWNPVEFRPTIDDRRYIIVADDISMSLSVFSPLFPLSRPWCFSLSRNFWRTTIYNM